MKKAVAQYTPDGKFIRTFESGVEAARSIEGKSTVEIKAGKINYCCNGCSCFAYGYRWLHESDMDRAEELFKERQLKRHNKGYTYEECYNEAKRYTRYVDFLTKSPSHWQRAKMKGWLSDYTWLERREVKKVAQYTLDGEFIRLYNNCDEAGRAVSKSEKPGECIRQCCNGKNSLMYGYKWLYASDMDRAEELFKERYRPQCRPPYTEEEILDEAAKYPTRSDFMKYAANYYNAACHRHILDKLPFDRKLNPYKDKLFCIYVYEFDETHSVYVGVTWKKEQRDRDHHNKKDSQVWIHANKYNIAIPEPKYPMEGLSGEQALIQEDAYRKKYEADGWNVLNKAKTGLNSGSLGALNGKYSLRQLRAAVKKCKTLSEFAENHRGLYEYASRNGYMGELDVLEREKVKRGFLNEEYCFNVAKKYNTIKEFYENDSSVYATARVNGWFNYPWLKRGRKRGGVVLSRITEDFNTWELLVFGSVKDVGNYFMFTGNKMFSEIERAAGLRGYSAYSLAE